MKQFLKTIVFIALAIPCAQAQTLMTPLNTVLKPLMARPVTLPWQGALGHWGEIFLP